MAPSRTPRGRPRASLDGAVDTPLSPRLASTKARTSSSRGSLMGLGESSEEPSELQDGTHYSTPATSTFTTPAPTEPAVKPATRKRGRRVVKEDSDDEDMETVAPLHPTERAAALRNSRYSNVPKRKRKRTALESDIDDDEEDHSRDAQVARALQKQEDAAADSMWPESGSGLRRTPRKLQKLFPTPIDEDFDDSDDPLGSRLAAKRPMVELKSSGANAVSLPAMIPDSDQTEDFMEIDDSEALSAFEEDSAWETSDAEGALPEIKKEKPKPKPKPKAAARRIQTPSLPVYSAIDLTGDDDELDSLALDSGDDDSRPTRDDHLGLTKRGLKDRLRLEMHHPELLTMWSDLENLPKIGQSKIDQPKNITRQLKPFQLEGVAWMKAMEKTDWGGGLLGDEMGMGKTIQAVTLIMSDWPAKQPTLVLMPPVALMQWQQEIAAYTDGTLKTFVHHGTNARAKGVSVAELKKYDVILMSYNSLESAYRKQTKGFQRKDGLFKEKSAIHQIQFHRVILDEAHSIKSRTSGSAKACFALKADHKWCLSGTPLQNRIGEFFSLVRFLEIQPFACYMCKQCTCTTLNWAMNGDNRCSDCNHSGMHHVSVFNQELLNPIMKFGNEGRGKVAFGKLRLLTDRFMLRRVKVNHSSAMELPAKEIYVDRQFFGEVENDFAGSIMNNSRRKFETYVDRGVMLNNYANIFGLIMQMRQVADHPDLILKKDGEGGQNVLVCCICDETAEDAIRSQCRHEFCRVCAKDYLRSSDEPDCPTCHIPLAIDLEQLEIAQDEQLVKKSSIINRIDMKSWTSSSKIETLVHDLHELRSKNMSHKSIIFSQFTTMLQLVEWRLRRAGITTVMLDGSMTPAQRQASINHFMTDPDVECFLVSLKAGGVALNLTEASQVFIVDPWWNPAAEWQSADRCHRIGQGRPCSITRLCIEDSVESRMVLLQEKKANMIHSTINADAAAMENLTIEDMQFLFRGS